MHHGLDIRYERGDAGALLEDRNVLALFEFGRSPLDAREARHVPVALPQLDDEAVLEVWRSRGPILTGHWEGMSFARCERVTMGHLALDLNEFEGMRAASFRAYELIQGFLRQSPHHCPMKIWNFIPGINIGEGDLERYRQFCIGRSEALAADPAEQPPMPAATAIGAPENEPALQIYFLATALPGVNVENPRQLNAWHYPRQYGPRSPLFSRGTIMQINDLRQFLISGTASVVGHETHHDNATDQVHESVRNVDSLLSEAQRLLGGPRPSLDDTGVLRVYVRQPEAFDEIRQALDDRVPASTPRIHLRGDICRDDLLVEMDGVLTCD